MAKNKKKQKGSAQRKIQSRKQKHQQKRLLKRRERDLRKKPSPLNPVANITEEDLAKAYASNPNIVDVIRSFESEELHDADISEPRSADPSVSRTKPLKPRRGRPRKVDPKLEAEKPAEPDSEPGSIPIMPALRSSPRFQYWKRKCEDVRATLPKGIKSWSAEDLPKESDRLWAARQSLRKERGGLRPWQIRILEETGFNWTRKGRPAGRMEAWERSFSAVVRQSRVGKHHDLARIEDPLLMNWIDRQRRSYAKGTLSEHRAARLEAIGIDWNARYLNKQVSTEALKTWLANFDQLRQVAVQDGALDERHINDPKLMTWINRQRSAYRRGALADWKRRKLEEIAISWEATPAPSTMEKHLEDWSTKIEQIRAIVRTNDGPDFRRLPNGELRTFLNAARRAYHRGDLDPALRDQLTEMEFDWKRSIGSVRMRTDDTARHAQLENFIKKYGPDKNPAQARKEFPGLAEWMRYMRQMRDKGLLDPTIIERLDSLGFVWNVPRGGRRRPGWEEMIERLRAFKTVHGHVDVPPVWPDDRVLGKWLNSIRRAMRGDRQLAPEQTRVLKELGVVSYHSQKKRMEWDERFHQVLEYLREHYGTPKQQRPMLPDDLSDLPNEHKRWLKLQRIYFTQGRLDTPRINELLKIGFDPTVPNPDYAYQLAPNERWNEMLNQLVQYKEEHGHTSPPGSIKPLGIWVGTQRRKFREGNLSSDRRKALERIGFSFQAEQRDEPTPRWMAHYRYLTDVFLKENGHADVPRSYPPNPPFAEWAAQQKQRRKKGMLKDFHIALLDKVGFNWENRPRTGRVNPYRNP